MEIREDDPMSLRPSSNKDPERAASATTERSPDPFFTKEPLRDGLSRDRSLPSLRAETGAALERQLLLVSAPGDEPVPPGVAPRWRVRLVLGVILGTLALSSIFFFVEVRGHWKGKVAALEGELERSRRESGQREETLRREAAEKDRQISERKAENQSLSALADKTLEELKAALRDLRTEREQTLKLQAEVKTALETRPARWLEALAGFLGKIPPDTPPPAGAKEEE
jgi:hypothetical protein